MENLEPYAKSVVIDLGSAQIKAGFCTEETPRIIFESVKGKTSAIKVLPIPSVKNKVGLPLTSNYFQKFERLIERGLLKKNEDGDSIISQIFEQLKLKNSDELSILFCNPLNAPLKQSSYLAQHCLEKLSLQGICFVSQPFMPLYAQGRTTGVVVEIGEGLMQSAAMVNGQKIKRSTFLSRLGGKDIDSVLSHVLLLKNHHFNIYNEFMILRQIKEKLCKVRSSSTPKRGPLRNSEDVYVCPDGEVVNLGTENTYPAETLFDPSIVGSSEKSLPSLIENIFNNIEIELVRPLAQNVLVSGESRNIYGLAERLEETFLQSEELTNLQFEISSEEKKFMVWSGAAKLNLNSEFFKTFIKKFEWEEFGDSLLIRKCL